MRRSAQAVTTTDVFRRCDTLRPVGLLQPCLGSVRRGPSRSLLLSCVTMLAWSQVIQHKHTCSKAIVVRGQPQPPDKFVFGLHKAAPCRLSHVPVVAAESATNHSSSNVQIDTAFRVCADPYARHDERGDLYYGQCRWNDKFCCHHCPQVRTVAPLGACCPNVQHKVVDRCMVVRRRNKDKFEYTVQAKAWKLVRLPSMRPSHEAPPIELEQSYMSTQMLSFACCSSLCTIFLHLSQAACSTAPLPSILPGAVQAPLLGSAATDV